MYKLRQTSIILFLTLLFVYYLEQASAFPNRANYGSDFIVAFPKGGQKSGVKNNGVLSLHMASLETVEVKIVTRPYWRGSRDPRLKSATITVRKGAVATYELDNSLQENEASYETTDNVVRVTVKNNKKIVLYAMNIPDLGGSDGFLVLPVDMLSTSYCFAFWEQNSRLSNALIVTLKDTLVKIDTPPVDGEWVNERKDVVIYPEARVTVDLFAYEVYTFTQTTIKSSYCINASNPVAVILGSRWTSIGSHIPRSRYGHMAEMISAFDYFAWETHVNNFIDLGDNTRYQIVVQKPASVKLFRLGSPMRSSPTPSVGKYAGEETLTIKSSFGEYFSVLVMSDSDITERSPVLSFVPTVKQYLNYYMLVVPPATLDRDSRPIEYTSYVTITAMGKDHGGIILDRVVVDPGLVPLDSVYTARNYPLSSGLHIITHKLPNVRFGAMLYGFNKHGDGFSFPAGMLSPSPMHCTPNNDGPGIFGLNDDCDRFIDEEWENMKDDDGDGRIDEDLLDEKRLYAATIVKAAEAVVPGEPTEKRYVSIIKTAVPTAVGVACVALIASVAVALREKKVVKEQLHAISGTIFSNTGGLASAQKSGKKRVELNVLEHGIVDSRTEEDTTKESRQTITSGNSDAIHQSTVNGAPLTPNIVRKSSEQFAANLNSSKQSLNAIVVHEQSVTSAITDASSVSHVSRPGNESSVGASELENASMASALTHEESTNEVTEADAEPLEEPNDEAVDRDQFSDAIY